MSNHDLEPLDANHPLLERVQIGLKSHLEKQLSEVNARISEQEQYIKTRKQYRQQLGNRVYVIQKDLVQCKNKINSIHEELEEQLEIRIKTEKELNKIESAHKNIKDVWGKKRDEERNYHIQIENQANQLAQLSRTEAEVFTGASVKKTEAEKSEKESKNLHVEKFRQDIYILGLSQEIERLELNLSSTKSSTETIQKETRELRDSLKNAKSYISSINDENQKLILKWKASLNALCKRNEAYSQLTEEHNDTKNQMTRLMTEIEVLNGKLRKTCEENSYLTQKSNKKQSQIDKLSREMEKATARHEEAQNEFTMYEKTLEETEKSIERLKKERTREELNFTNVNKRIAITKQSIMKLKSTMATRFAENKTSDIESKRYAEKFAHFQSENRDKEEELLALDLKIFAINMEISTYESQVDTVQEILDNLRSENFKKEQILCAKEGEVENIFKEIDKKQEKVANLKKKIADFLTVTGGKELGPTELELERLESEIEEIEKDTLKMQSKWLSGQSQMLALQKSVLERKSASQKLQSESVILNARKKRLSDNLNVLNGEKELIEKQLGKLRGTKDSLNVLLQKKRLAKKQIESKLQSVKDELTELTESLELELEKNKKDLDEFDTEKEATELKIVSAREDLIKIERKITEFESARTTLKNGRYAEEIQALTTNIHRKQVYLDQLKRERESLIRKMEKAINLQDGLLVKVDNAANGHRKTDAKVIYENQITHMKRQITKVSKDLTLYQKKIEQMQNDEKNLLDCVKEEESRIEALEKEKQLKEEQLQTLLQEKYKSTYLLSLKQLKQKYYEMAVNGKYIKRYTNKDASSEMSKAKEELRETATICQQVVKNYPQTKDNVLKILALRDCLFEL